MAVPSRSQNAGADPAGEADDTERTRVSTHRTNPDRTVFIEENNSDGWIATDLTVVLDR
jgi:hypothetical protein